MEAWVNLFRDILAPDINRLRADIGLPPVDNWVSWLGYPERSIALWPDWFAEPDHSWPAGVIPVGFLTDDEGESDTIPEEVKGILAGDKPPILITGGTGMYFAPNFYAVSSAACQLLDLPAVLVTPYQKLLPAHLPPRVKWFKYLPFSKLMAHMAAVIHHGGIGTLACAVAAGIPQLIFHMALIGRITLSVCIASGLLRFTRQLGGSQT